MSEQNSIDVTSLNIVFDEINTTLLQASHDFEAFVSDIGADNCLTNCQYSINQVSGVLNLLGLSCAYSLSHHLHLVIEKINTDRIKNKPFAYKSAGHALVGLSCYLEYLVDKQMSCRPLILPFINELRAVLDEPLLFESEESQFSLRQKRLQALASDQAPIAQQALKALFRRMRTLYQIGLVGLIYEENTQIKLQLMHHAMSRLSTALSMVSARTLWRLAEAALEGFLTGALELTFSRKRVLSMVDTALRDAIEMTDISTFYGQDQLIIELAYWVKLSSCQHKASNEVLTGLMITPSEQSDQYLQDQRAVMQGPSAETVDVMVKVILQELNSVRETFETFAESQSMKQDFTDSLALFTKIKGILTVVGANEASQLLSQLCCAIKNLQANATCEELLSMADTLLHIESLLGNLTRLDLHGKAAIDVTATQDKQKLMAKSQLKDAEKQLTVEALANLSAARQAFTSFLESACSLNLIQAIIEPINTVKGALEILGHDRASDILSKTIACLIAVREDNATADRDSVFQSIADTLIALEYYLSEIQSPSETKVSVLMLAEQGFTDLAQKSASYYTH